MLGFAGMIGSSFHRSNNITVLIWINLLNQLYIYIYIVYTNRYLNTNKLYTAWQMLADVTNMFPRPQKKV